MTVSEYIKTETEPAKLYDEKGKRMYYKTFSERLRRAGWQIIDERHENHPNEPGRLIPHYFKYAHPHDDSRDGRNVIEITTDSNKDGTPGKIRQVWQGWRRVRI